MVALVQLYDPAYAHGVRRDGRQRHHAYRGAVEEDVENRGNSRDAQRARKQHDERDATVALSDVEDDIQLQGSIRYAAVNPIDKPLLEN